jgi:phosphopantetheinyl transferase (holo-ACP synthase)
MIHGIGAGIARVVRFDTALRRALAGATSIHLSFSDETEFALAMVVPEE